MSDLVGNPEDRFSRVNAHMTYIYSVGLLLTITLKYSVTFIYKTGGITLTSLQLSEGVDGKSLCKYPSAPV